MNTIEHIARSHGFTLLRSESIPEIEGLAHVMRHRASDARLLFLQNEDPNKAFSISFKTPAADDTGVFHILEHSVLCGSERFPVKEPFVNLLKSSMQTFLNAMTFPDKTMYPVASTNEQDLLNLMDVYLDAVFHPAIYEKRSIFEQEGWHYEVTRDHGRPELAYNGVVFNEMKGALSDPDSVLYDALSAALFPDTTYRFESGGTPDAIPSLTYESFLDHHARHYRPDNSYITLYGNLDLEVFLRFLDERYLAPLAASDKAPLDANPLDEQDPVIAEDIVKTMATARDNAACAMGFVVGHARDRERIVATDILLDAIMGSNEAPLKRALLDSGIAADATAFLADALLQPFAVIQLKGLRDRQVHAFKETLLREARRLADGGLDHELIEASLSRAEFVMREGSFGYADGVIYAIASMSGWLYDDELACAYLRYDDIFKSLRAKIEGGYFERLLRELVLESAHHADVELLPHEADEGREHTRRLIEIAANMNESDFEDIEHDVEALRLAQEADDDPADLAKLPQLLISDIGDAPVEAAYALDNDQPLATLRHDAQKHGIVYTYRYFDLSGIAFEDLPYVTVLSMVLGKLGTANRSAAQLDTAIQGKLGSFSAFAEVHENAFDRNEITPKLVIGASALEDNVEHLATLTREILAETAYADKGKILDILTQKKVSLEQAYAAAGHSAAMSRVSSYYLPAGVVRESLGGMDFYLFLKALLLDWDNRADALLGKLANLSNLILTDDNCLLSWSGSDDALKRFWEAGAPLGRTGAAAAKLIVPEPQAKTEAFVTPSDVTYTAMGCDQRLLGKFEFSGTWLVAARALSYGYLWNEVRVKGGAYGCGFQAKRTGDARFYSYRDPRIDETIERFRAGGTWLSQFDPSETEMSGYVVSTTAGFDAPQKTRELVRRQDGQFFSGYTPEMRAKTRREIIGTTPEMLRATGHSIREIADHGVICVFGNRAIIESSTHPFEVVGVLS